MISCVCLPTEKEFPRPYWKRRRPVIVTTDVPGCREVVEEEVNGYLVPPRDPESLAKKIEELINDPEKRKMFGANSRMIAVSQFSEDIVVRKTMEIYKSLLT